MFWDELKKPFFALAPMHDVTDAAFRETLAHFGKPDVIFTEFVSVDGLCHEKSREKMNRYYLQFTNAQRPIVAQIWGNNPEHFFEAAKYVASLGFDGIDINMGCPDKSVIKQGGGAALILDFNRAKEIIEATKKGAGNLPVSVKTRIGFDEIITESWIGSLLSSKPAVITIHGRTKKELSRVPAHWDEIGKAAQMAKGSGIYIIGNGDVSSKKQGIDLAEKFSLDGIMVGRAVIGNPWFFSDIEISGIPVSDKLSALEYHAKKFDEYFTDIKRFAHFRKHIKGYISDFNGAKELRTELMSAKDSLQLSELIKKHRDEYIVR